MKGCVGLAGDAFRPSGPAAGSCISDLGTLVNSWRGGCRPVKGFRQRRKHSGHPYCLPSLPRVLF